MIDPRTVDFLVRAIEGTQRTVTDPLPVGARLRDEWDKALVALNAATPSPALREAEAAAFTALVEYLDAHGLTNHPGYDPRTPTRG